MFNVLYGMYNREQSNHSCLEISFEAAHTYNIVGKKTNVLNKMASKYLNRILTP